MTRKYKSLSELAADVAAFLIVVGGALVLFGLEVGAAVRGFAWASGLW